MSESNQELSPRFQIFASAGLFLLVFGMAVWGFCGPADKPKGKDPSAQVVISRFDARVEIDAASNALLVSEEFEIDNTSGIIPHGFKRLVPAKRPSDGEKIEFEFEEVNLIRSEGGAERSDKIQFMRQSEMLRIGSLTVPMPREKLHFQVKYKVKNVLAKNDRENILRWYSRPGMPWKIEQFSLNIVGPSGLPVSYMNSRAAIRRKEIEPGRFRYVFGEEIQPVRTESGFLVSPTKGLAVDSDLALEVTWPS